MQIKKNDTEGKPEMQEKLKVEIQTNKQYTYQLAISIHQNLNMYVEKKKV